jgi:hypothetical protein
MIVALLAFISRATALIEAPSSSRCNAFARPSSVSTAGRPNFFPSALALRILEKPMIDVRRARLCSVDDRRFARCRLPGPSLGSRNSGLSRLRARYVGRFAVRPHCAGGTRFQNSSNSRVSKKAIALTTILSFMRKYHV